MLYIYKIIFNSTLIFLYFEIEASDVEDDDTANQVEEPSSINLTEKNVLSYSTLLQTRESISSNVADKSSLNSLSITMPNDSNPLSLSNNFVNEVQSTTSKLTANESCRRASANQRVILTQPLTDKRNEPIMA